MGFKRQTMAQKATPSSGFYVANDDSKDTGATRGDRFLQKGHFRPARKVRNDKHTFLEKDDFCRKACKVYAYARVVHNVALVCTLFNKSRPFREMCDCRCVPLC